VHDALSIAAARRALAARLRAAGLDTPDLDARILVGHALGLDHTALVASSDRILTAAETDRLDGFTIRRLAREPVARIVGTKEFWGLPLRVTPDVLVPRPDTETVVEVALELVDRGGPRSRPLRIADLGTGTGAILLALLTELPNAVGTGIDSDPGAIAVAQENAAALNLRQRATMSIMDFRAMGDGPFDLVVSNPPYIATHDIAELAPDVRDYDPTGALDGGPEGLDAYRTIATVAPRILAPRGIVVVEIGQGQEQDIAKLFSAAGLVEAAPPRRDIGGIVRALSVKMAC
jgi:release factor glutamine methyltransferase